MATTATKTKSKAKAEPEISWLDADKDYGLGILNGKLVCRNSKGKKLAAVPKWLKETELADQLLALCDWLAEHETECRHRVELWMLRSLPIPREAVESTWADPGWSGALRNMVVTPVDAKGKIDHEQTGLLRDVVSSKGIGIVDRDGETQWIKAAQILVPHPILIDGLEDLREIAVDMQFSQVVNQLFRTVFSATEEQQEFKRIMDFQGGRFEQLNFATSLCKRLGYPVRGGYACNRIWENEVPLEARYWVGDDYPEAETCTEELIFVDEDQVPQKISDVGPVTFSEGMLMASQIYAKRKVEKTEGETA
ncbi:hypothetical protein Enr10x_29900 [Gimesia panareensis]|uniref:DUF4132 domain-containing protein n=1 Tax=Gimesia panareensis TaxID=2527978 RepID=A0A517Q7R2_9PLAN|nr:DUF4132 domain-containing protein [Gimesia panareensis]QDT27672.1 hypothetical protein Enr10x_29900 [Gimesia panareensis]